MRALSSPLIVTCQSPPTAPLGIIKLGNHMKPRNEVRANCCYLVLIIDQKKNKKKKLKEAGEGEAGTCYTAGRTSDLSQEPQLWEP